MNRETLRVTWKIIRKAGQGRNINTYCSYIVQNENRKHRLKTNEGTKLFDILSNTTILKNGGDKNVFVDGIYHKDNLKCVVNPRTEEYD